MAEEEQEAEMLASLILERFSLADSHEQMSLNTEHAELFERLASSLETKREEH
jgi:hypothetical protein